MAEGPTTANSLILDPEWGHGKDSPVVARLKAAGAVITGKVTTMEFACGVADPSKPFPIPRNPWDLETWPGGSSSGTGNGIAAGMFYAGIGTDTGGSIRIPAAFCGTSGLMPTFGRVPKSGCVPLGYSLDHIGPLARSARDCAAMLSVIAGYHPSDESCADRPVDDYLGGLDRRSHRDQGRRRTGPSFPRRLRSRPPGVLRHGGRHPRPVSARKWSRSVFPGYDQTNAAVMATMASEALAYHRNDLQARWTDYFAATRLVLALGSLVSASDFVQAQRVRRVVQGELQSLLAEVDVIVSPTAAIGAPRIDSMTPDSIFALMNMVFTTYWDGTGNPALVLPMGFTAGGLPLSLQVAGRPFDEATVLRVGDAYQTVTDWHARVAPVSVAAAA